MGLTSVLLSTLGVAAVAACLVALGDYHGYQGPVALAQTAAGESLLTNLSWAEQAQKARDLIAKAAEPKTAVHARPMSKRMKHQELIARRHKVEELVAQRQKAIAARLARVQGKLSEQQMASKMLMQGAKKQKVRKLKGFRPVHLFGGEFSKQEAAREHRRSAGQELSHLTKLNNEIFGAAPKVHWKVQSADQELASFSSINKRVIGAKKYSHLAADTAAKELAQDTAMNALVFPKRSKARAAFKGVSAASELKHLKAVDDRVVPQVCALVCLLVPQRRKERVGVVLVRVRAHIRQKANSTEPGRRRTCRQDMPSRASCRRSR
jgi:hypothetical protein